MTISWCQVVQQNCGSTEFRSDGRAHTACRHPAAIFPENRENNREFFKNLPLDFYLFGLSLPTFSCFCCSFKCLSKIGGDSPMRCYSHETRFLSYVYTIMKPLIWQPMEFVARRADERSVLRYSPGDGGLRFASYSGSRSGIQSSVISRERV